MAEGLAAEAGLRLNATHTPVALHTCGDLHMRLTGAEDRVRMDVTGKPEFDGWRWVSYWYPLGQVVTFKREVYRRALKELAPRLLARD